MELVILKSADQYSPDFNVCLANFHRHHWRQLGVETLLLDEPEHGKMLLNHLNNQYHPHLQVKGRKEPNEVYHRD